MSSSEREFQQKISDRIDEFVADITRLAREHAFQSLASALDASGASRPTLEKSKPGSRRKRGKKELEEVCAALLMEIVAKPGLRMQELAAALGTTPKELALPSKRLLADKLVRTEGQKRSTSYFPTAKAKKQS